MPPQASWPTRRTQYIATVLPWTPGHQLKGLTPCVGAILETQTGTPAQVARGLGPQEAAAKRRSRLLPNARLPPHHWAAAVLAQALRQVPSRGRVRLALDWTIEGRQPWLVVSLVRGGHAVPLYWRAYAATGLKGRMKRYEQAVIRRAGTQGHQALGRRRLMVTADRGFADVALVAVRSELGVECRIRVTGSPTVYLRGQWCALNTLRGVGSARQRTLGRLSYCASAPHQLGVPLSRARDTTGPWERWDLRAHRPRRAHATAAEDARRFGCEPGGRAAKWGLGFAQARIQALPAWSRLFALVALALRAVGSVAVNLLLPSSPGAVALLRRVASRRRGRWDVSLGSARGRWLHGDTSLFAPLSPRIQFNLHARLVYVS
jgi:hypothetical protein